MSRTAASLPLMIPTGMRCLSTNVLGKRLRRVSGMAHSVASTIVLAAVVLAVCATVAVPFAGSQLKIPLGLSLPYIPPENPVTAEKARLGALLFFDKRLSA